MFQKFLDLQQQMLEHQQQKYSQIQSLTTWPLIYDVVTQQNTTTKFAVEHLPHLSKFARNMDGEQLDSLIERMESYFQTHPNLTTTTKLFTATAHLEGLATKCWANVSQHVQSSYIDDGLTLVVKLNDVATNPWMSFITTLQLFLSFWITPNLLAR
jgi:hypothetical protein